MEDKTLQKILDVIESCETSLHIECTEAYLLQYYTLTNDLVTYNHFMDLLEIKKKSISPLHT